MDIPPPPPMLPPLVQQNAYVEPEFSCICASSTNIFYPTISGYTNNIQSINLIDGTQNFVKRSIYSPSCMCLSLDGQELFVQTSDDDGSVPSYCFDVLNAADGTYIRSFGQRGLGLEHIREPSGIFVEGHEIFVSDGYHNRIQVLNADGTYKRTIRNGGLFFYPGDICISNGELFVADTENDRIQVLRVEDGTYVRTIMGRGIGPVIRPTAICVSGDYLFVAHDNRLSPKKCVQVLSIDGTHVRFIGDDGRFSRNIGICVSPDGREFFVVDTKNDNSRVNVFKV